MEIQALKNKNQDLEDVNKHHLATIRKLQIKVFNPPDQQEMDSEPIDNQSQEEFPPLNPKKTHKRAASPIANESQRQKQNHAPVN